MSEAQPPDNPWRKLGLFTVIVADLIGCTVGGLGLGYWAHKKWGAPTWVMGLTALAGLCVAMVHVYKIGRREL